MPSLIDNHKLYWRTTPLPFIPNTYTHLANIQPNSILTPPIITKNNYFSSNYYQKYPIQNRESFESMLLSKESLITNIINKKNEKFNNVLDDKLNIGSLTMRQLYEKTLHILCRWLPKLFHNITINECIDSINRNTRLSF